MKCPKNMTWQEYINSKYFGMQYGYQYSSTITKGVFMSSSGPAYASYTSSGSPGYLLSYNGSNAGRTSKIIDGALYDLGNTKVYRP